MYHDIAIEPEAIQSWRDFQVVLALCGFGKGRLISLFPKKGPSKKEKEQDWGWMVLQGLKGEARKRVEALLVNPDWRRRNLLRPSRSYDHGSPWLENAKCSNHEEPFAAILTHATGTCAGSVCLDDISPDQGGCPSILVEDQHAKPLPKDPGALATALRPLLWSSNRILLVDAYYYSLDKRGAWKNNYQRALRETARVIADGPRNPTLEIHGRVEDGTPEGWARLLPVLKKEIPPLVPDGLRVTVNGWGEHGKRFHARYVLTDVGGAGSEYGLDKSSSRDDNTDIYLLPHKMSADRLREFGADSDVYRHLGSETIVGSR